MLTKVCTTCEAEKSVDEYSKQKRGKYGVTSECKFCRNRSNVVYYETNKGTIAIYREANRETIAETKKKHYQANREVLLQQKRAYYEANREGVLERVKTYNQANPHIAGATRAKRRARTDNIIFTEFDELVFKEAADLRTRRSQITNTPWHIDHIVPLNHKNASGLHNGYNIQVVPGDWNIKKGNRNMNTYFNLT